LAAGAVAAALTRVYLAAIGQEPLEGLDVFVVDVFVASPAETTLRLFAPQATRRSAWLLGI